MIGWAALSLLLIGLATSGTVGWMKWNASEEQLANTRSRLDSTASSLTATSATLEATRGDRDSKAATLRETKAQLDTAQAKLRRARGSLTDSQDRLDLQAGQIDTLQTCLGGVTESLSWVANGYISSALAALRAVEGPCRDANSIL